MKNFNTTTVKKHMTDNPPNAAKLLSSMRCLDYSNVLAICDIVDNSIDAGATEIYVDIEAEGKKNIKEIVIWDNGVGMSPTMLIEAMKLGSKSHKDSDHYNNLGKFGMGLITASLSIGKKLTVETFQGEHVYSAVQDLNIIEETNKFQIETHLFSEKEKTKWLNDADDFFDISKSGTVVTISDIDKWGWTLLSTSEQNLKKTLGQVFRKFIEGGDNAKRKIYVNDEQVIPIDPVLDLKPELLEELAIDLHGETIAVKLYVLPNHGKSVDTSHNINMQNQGFYLLRNNREIAVAQNLDLFRKHNNFNHFRAELFYPATLDDDFKTGFTKQRIEISQALRDKLREPVNRHIKHIKREAEKRKKDRRKKVEDFSQVEKFIQGKSNLLTMPPSTDGEEGRTHTVKFTTESNSEFAPLYNCEVKGRTTTIIWNVDHPFYTEFIVPFEKDKDVLHPICFLIFTLATQELSSIEGSEQQRMLENIRVQSSQDLRVLMKI